MKRILSCLLMAVMLLCAAVPALAFTDSTGRDVEVPETIDRIVPASPIAQMVLLALCPEKMVALSAKWPSGSDAYLQTDTFDLPVIGQIYSTGDLNLEELASLDPQLIIDIGETKKNAADDLNAVTDAIGIPAVHIEAQLSDMGTAFRTLGALLGCEKRAEELAVYCEEVYARAAALPEKAGEKPTLLYILGENGLNVIANGSFHAEVFDLLSDNVAVVDDISSKGTGNEVDMEQLYLWDPQVILFQQGSVYATAGEDSLWSQMQAIEAGQYVEVPVGPYNWLGFQPSVNRFMGLIWLGDLLYPDVVEYDLFEEAVRYYALFYQCELTQEMYEGLTENALFK